ncbi:hypothetical protein FRB96_006164 [Tulasnella sp. 330]|nr:hypothetical protein FRB96_006164 [Tulasnella sp. 330]
MSVFTFSTPDLEGGRISRMDDKGNGALTYKLPELVESVRQGWIYSAQGAAVVSALLCGAETQLITIVQGIDMTTPKVVENPAALRFLTLLSYSAFVINASATIASLLMIDRLGEIPLRAKRFFDKHVGPLPPLDYGYLLELHAAGGRWTWMKWHSTTMWGSGAVKSPARIIVTTNVSEPESSTMLWDWQEGERGKKILNFGPLVVFSGSPSTSSLGPLLPYGDNDSMFESTAAGVVNVL